MWKKAHHDFPETEMTSSKKTFQEEERDTWKAKQLAEANLPEAEFKPYNI